MPRPPARKPPAAHALLLAFVLACGTVRAAPVEELVRLPSAEGATLPVLIGWDDADPPLASAVLFNGGNGVVGLLRRIPRPGGNFLVRTRELFNAQRVATAVIDVPTDLNGLNDGLRMGRRHADDVRSVVAELRRRFGGRPVFLVGTSRGTVSAAYAGAALGGAIDGVVLTSSAFNATRGGGGISSFDYATLAARLLLVHHVDDECPATPYFMAERIGRGRTLVSVHGGDPPRSDPCEAFSPHGFLGVERPTVQAIVRWMLGEEPPRRVP